MVICVGLLLLCVQGATRQRHALSSDLTRAHNGRGVLEKYKRLPSPYREHHSISCKSRDLEQQSPLQPQAGLV